MMLKNKLGYAFLFIIILTMPFSLYAQTGGQLFSRWLVWREGEYVYRYAVEIEKRENRVYQNYHREFTTSTRIMVNLPVGDYRFRVIPHDILDRPGTGSRWVNFTVRAPARGAGSDQVQNINIDSGSQTADGGDSTPIFNTLGVSIGSSFIDPLFVATIHGSYSPINNLYVQAGMDTGFVSAHEKAESYYCLYPFLNLGYYYPINDTLSLFAAAGIGFMYSNYTISSEEFGQIIFGQNIIAFNMTAGVHLWNMINISYTIKTDFDTASNLISVGYVYRFR